LFYATCVNVRDTAALCVINDSITPTVSETFDKQRRVNAVIDTLLNKWK